jgi:bifunctional non-homologous end joining protein LigD
MATRKRPATKAATKKAATRKATAKKTAAKKAATKKAAPATRAKLTRYRQKRDFAKTAEPSGDKPAASRRALRFVIQKHAASHLHFDWRLELDGVMKSWAVPKGPSVVPGVRRLAMEVEDHPISYNTFEGTIPAGEYGGGTVMLWDRGTYEATDGGGAASLREGYAKGKLDITLHGERLEGAFTMVRTRGDGERAQWLLITRTDAHAAKTRELVDTTLTSVVSGRTMEEIAEGVGRKRVWRSTR